MFISQRDTRNRMGIFTHFAKREDGTITVLALLILVMMLAAGGMGIDLVRAETERVRMQYTLDRAVLAGAATSSSAGAESVVKDYFQKAGLDGYTIDVDMMYEDGVKTVAAQAFRDVPSLFLNMVGVDSLRAPAAAEASQQAAKIEISLVLDISTSMTNIPSADGSSRMIAMQNAATQFITDIMSVPGATDYLSISVIPYTGTVNAGPEFGPYLPFTNEHSYSYCADFETVDFSYTGLGSGTYLQRRAHFDRFADEDTNGNQLSQMRYEWCLPGTNTAIIPWSNDTAAMVNLVNNFDMPIPNEHFTAINMGVKWGALMLDPELQSVAFDMALAGDLPAERGNNFPAFHSDTTVQKVLIVLTDGRNYAGFEMQDGFYSGLSPVWRHEGSTDAQDKLSIYLDDEDRYLWHEDPNGNGTRHTSPQGASAAQLTWRELWASYPHEWIRDTLYDHAPSAHRSNIGGAIVRPPNGDETMNLIYDDQMLASCNAAKSAGITIFAIELERSLDAPVAFSQCASSDAHYYNTLSADLSDAFGQVAFTVGKLRLTK